MTPRPPHAVSRRSALRALGVVAGGVGLSQVIVPGSAAAAASSTRAPSSSVAETPTVGVTTPTAGVTTPTAGVTTSTTATPPLTVAAWRAGQSSEIYVAHRGSGDVYPEHTMPAYQAAVDWGARCLEVSVAITSDGVLICMHDATYDRTTNGTGAILEQPSAVLDTIRVIQPQLGAAWTVDPPPVPLLEEVLAAFGGAVVLCIEAKVREAYEPMVALIEQQGLQDSVILKVHYTSSTLELAMAAGYPLFAYLGSEREVTVPNIVALGGQLRKDRDVLVIAAVQGPPRQPYLPDELVAAAVATGIPVWVFPLHRRSEARHFFDLGVQGAICSSYGYLADVVDPVTRDSWATQRIASGEVSKSPDVAANAPEFTAAGWLVLGAPGRQHFMMLGQFCPVPAAAGSYSLDVDLCWLTPPEWQDDNLSIAFGHTDDRYYQHRQGVGTGYHVTLRPNGRLGLYLHRENRVSGGELASIQTPKLVVGKWAHLRIDVTPTFITARRTDTGHGVSAIDTTTRGGYVHVGRSSSQGSGAFRRFTIS